VRKQSKVTAMRQKEGKMDKIPEELKVLAREHYDEYVCGGDGLDYGIYRGLETAIRKLEGLCNAERKER